MILSQFFTTEIAENEGSSDDLPANTFASDLNENVSGVIHHDMIEAIHKEILQRSQDIDLITAGEGLTLEGIVHLDSRESHYRVKTEILGSIGPVYAVKICTITHSSPGAVEKNIKASSSKSQFDILDERLQSLEGIEIQCINKAANLSEVNNVIDREKNGDSPIDFSSKLSPAEHLDPSLKLKIKEVVELHSTSVTRNNAMLNKIEEVLRGPTSYSSSGASGFGFGVHKKKGSDVLNLFLCPLCIYCCVKKGELKKHHTAVHLDGKPYGCSFCPYRSTHKSTLRSHVMSRHTGERPFECPHCDYKASQKGLVDKHIMTKHTGEKPFKCPHCDFSSSHSSTVKTHIMFKHTGEKPFDCPHCQYKAVQRGHIVRHIRAVHSGEKPFQCPHCDYKACRNTNIKKHIVAVHNKEKPHQCPYCEFKSSHKGNLNSHMISKHTEMKPFVCQLCDYKSSCRTGLNRHLLKHKGIKKVKLECSYCSYSSDRKDHLRTHVSFVHFKGNKSLMHQFQSIGETEGNEKTQTNQNTEKASGVTTNIDLSVARIHQSDLPSTNDPD